MLEDRSDASPVDTDHAWFDTWLVTAAEAYWRRKFNKPAETKRDHLPRTEAELAWATAMAAKARANIAAWATQKRRVHAPVPEPATAFVEHEIPETVAGRSWRDDAAAGNGEGRLLGDSARDAPEEG